MVCLYASIDSTGYTRKLYFRDIILVIRLEDGEYGDHGTTVTYTWQSHDDPSLEEDYDFFTETDSSILEDVCAATYNDFRFKNRLNECTKIHLPPDILRSVETQCLAFLKSQKG